MALEMMACESMLLTASGKESVSTAQESDADVVFGSKKRGWNSDLWNE